MLGDGVAGGQKSKKKSGGGGEAQSRKAKKRAARGRQGGKPKPVAPLEPRVEDVDDDEKEGQKEVEEATWEVGGAGGSEEPPVAEPLEVVGEESAQEEAPRQEEEKELAQEGHSAGPGAFRAPFKHRRGPSLMSEASTAASFKHRRGISLMSDASTVSAETAREVDVDLAVAEELTTAPAMPSDGALPSEAEATPAEALAEEEQEAQHEWVANGLAGADARWQLIQCSRVCATAFVKRTFIDAEEVGVAEAALARPRSASVG